MFFLNYFSKFDISDSSVLEFFGTIIPAITTAVIIYKITIVRQKTKVTIAKMHYQSIKKRNSKRKKKKSSKKSK